MGEKREAGKRDQFALELKLRAGETYEGASVRAGLAVTPRRGERVLEGLMEAEPSPEQLRQVLVFKRMSHRRFL